MPCRGESAEVIQAYHVDMREQGTQPIDPPAIAHIPQSLPVVNGIAPELAGGAEVVGRHACDKEGPPVFIQPEQLRIGPYVA